MICDEDVKTSLTVLFDHRRVYALCLVGSLEVYIGAREA